MMPRHTSSHEDILHPRRIMENLSCCPGSVSTYAASHMDTISKILNHLLALVVLLDILLFLASFNVAFLPNLGFSTFFVALLLLAQGVLVWLILNNHRISVASCLAPTDFKIGLAFGITVGAVILSFFVAHSFRNTAQLCDPYHAHTTPATRFLSMEYYSNNNYNNMATPPNSRSAGNYLQYESMAAATATEEPVKVSNANNSSTLASASASSSTSAPTNPPASTTYLPPSDIPQDFIRLCDQRKGSMVAVWFWSGLSFWCNFVICLLLWVGHSELSQSTQYENLSMEDYENHFAQQQRNSTGNAFVGDYATVPEIRPDSHLSRPSGSSSSSIPTGYGPTSGYSDRPHITPV